MGPALGTWEDRRTIDEEQEESPVVVFWKIVKDDYLQLGDEKSHVLMKKALRRREEFFHHPHSFFVGKTVSLLTLQHRISELELSLPRRSASLMKTVVLVVMAKKK